MFSTCLFHFFMLAIIDTSIPLSKGTNSIIELWRVGTFIETWYYCNNNAEDLMFCVIFCMEMHIYFLSKMGKCQDDTSYLPSDRYI